MANAEQSTDQEHVIGREQLRVLIVEDSPDDAELAELELTNAGYDVFALRVESEAAMQNALAEREWDVIIADYAVPGFGSVPALNLLRRTGRDIPFIIVSGSITDQTAVAAMRAGAHDYLLKDNIARLVPAIEREMQESKTRHQKRQMEAALREKEQRLRATFNNAAVGIIEVDSNGRLLAVNDRLCGILGYSHDEMLKMSLHDLTYPEDRPKTAEINASINEGIAETFSYEKRYLKRDGSSLWVHVTVSGVRDDKGRVVRAIATIEDIDERIQANRAAEERRRILEAVMENIPMGITIADAPDVRIRAVSRFGRDLIDKTSDELTDIPASEHAAKWEIYHADGSPAQAEELPLTRATVNGELVKAEEWCVGRRDGRTIPILCTAAPIRNDEGQITGGVIGWQDISERKRAERDLSQAKQIAETRLAQLRATLDSMTEGLYIVDAEGGTVMMNRALQEMFGLDPARSLSEHRSYFELLDLSGNELLLRDWPSSRVLRGEVLHRFELRARRRDDKKERIFSYNGAPVRDASGRVAMAVLTVEDITTAKQTQEALIRSEKLAATGRLAATIAHEINNPLESMVNVVYLLDKSITDATARGYLSVIDKQIQTLSRIANQTLKFHRENGQPVDYSLAELVTELLEFYEPKAMKHGVSISQRLDTAARVFGFIGEIRQVVSNLLLNAIEATPKGGRITVHVHESREWRSGRKGYRLSVVDTGSGVDRDHMARIFEPFFTTKGEKGTGLGLWVSMGIINRAGGSMRVWSTKRAGRSGTCFSVFLPAKVPVIESPGRRRFEVVPRANEGNTEAKEAD